MKNRYLLSLLIIMSFFVLDVNAQKEKKDKYSVENAEETIAEFKKKDQAVAGYFESAYAYAVFPSIGKGAIGVGGAGGHGVVYEQGKAVGGSDMSQISVGLQLGGQKYSEVIFFEDENAFNRFIADKYTFAAQVSAVAVASGESADAKYEEGVLVFTMPLGGLMFEAAVGGQKFKFHPF